VGTSLVAFICLPLADGHVRPLAGLYSARASFVEQQGRLTEEGRPLAGVETFKAGTAEMRASTSPPPLAGMKVMVVEDQFLIAEDISRSVVALGGEVVGPFPDLSQARAAVEEQPVDLALLDVQLGSADVFPLVDVLNRRKVPFIFATGYDRWILPPTHHKAPRLEKPVKLETLRDAIATLTVPKP
jgi:CheY-like chemotaxis protein